MAARVTATRTARNNSLLAVAQRTSAFHSPIKNINLQTTPINGKTRQPYFTNEFCPLLIKFQPLIMQPAIIFIRLVF
jgi:hypothetical protein